MYLSYMVKNYFSGRVTLEESFVVNEEDAKKILEKVENDNNLELWGATLWESNHKKNAIKDLR